jgi:peptidoglycan hydrolase-like protein with peptidoglycan-binding domain
MIAGVTGMHRQSVLASLLLVAAFGVVTIGTAQAQNTAQAPGSIATLQRELQQAGYDPGPVDGIVSDKTRAALAAYERATGHAPDGLPGDPAADAVANAQAALHRLGFLAQAPDGIVGPQTRTAIIRFETADHLPVDPRVGDRLLAALQQAAAQAASSPVMPPRVPLPPGVTPPPIPAPASAPPAAAPNAPAPAPAAALPPGVTPPPISPPAAASQATLPPAAVPPPASAPAAATPPAALGRQALPAGVTPPPIH